MTTTIYFIRHCEPNYDNHDDLMRELSEKGLQDRQLILDFFKDKEINHIFSSPYKRAIDTVTPLAEKLALKIQLEEDFRERKVDSSWIDDFTAFTKYQWSDFTYKLADGESLQEVQNRNIAAFYKLINDYPDNIIVIASHGTAISTIINYFNPSWDYAAFEQIKALMPFLVKLTVDDTICLSITLYNIFTGEHYDIHSL